MNEALALLPGYLAAHIELTLTALFVGVALSIPLGILAARVRWIERIVLTTASVVQTIPSLALLAIMVPLLAAFGLPSIGYLPAFLGLVAYSVLPVLRNTVTGLAGVDPSLLEAARALGMTPRQSLLRVELPLARPTIIAGLRTAAVWTVGLATLSTPVGATSLGNFIFSGLQTRNFAAVTVGCVGSAALALFLDGWVRVLSFSLDRKKRALTIALVGALAALLAIAAASSGSAARRAMTREPSRIVIGAKTFTEQYILSEILAAEIESVTQKRPEILASLGSTVAFDALCAGQIDVYVDYSGTLWATVLKRASTSESRDVVLAEVKRELELRYPVLLIAALGFENSYAIAMPKAKATALGLRTIGDLQPHAGNMTMGGDYEFFSRAEWRSVRETYNLAFASERSMDPSLMYQAVAQGTVDAISAFSTDGRIASFDLVVLEDNRHAIPPYDAVVLTSARLAASKPDVVAALTKLSGTIDNATMRRMNREVDEKHRQPADVARVARSARKGSRE